jgi:hypothetical protein
MILALDELTLQTDLSIANVFIYDDELIEELLFIMVLPLTLKGRSSSTVVPLLNVVIPETFNELVLVFKCIILILYHLIN